MDLTTLKNRDLVKKQLSEMEPAYTPSFHHFTDGLYTRETHMPAGSVAIGEIHNWRKNSERDRREGSHSFDRFSHTIAYQSTSKEKRRISSARQY